MWTATTHWTQWLNSNKKWNLLEFKSSQRLGCSIMAEHWLQSFLLENMFQTDLIFSGIQYGEGLLRRNQQANARRAPDCTNLPCKFWGTLPDVAFVMIRVLATTTTSTKMKIRCSLQILIDLITIASLLGVSRPYFLALFSVRLFCSTVSSHFFQYQLHFPYRLLYRLLLTECWVSHFLAPFFRSAIISCLLLSDALFDHS